METSVPVPEGVTVSAEDGTLIVKGEKGELRKRLLDKFVGIMVEGSTVKFSSIKAKSTKKQKRVIMTFRAHLNNMMKGVTEGHVYQLKICSGHFPMNVSYDNKKIIVKNFLGERSPRELKITKDVEVKVEGDRITVEGPDREMVGQAAASIESLCRITNRDRRIFQDGIYITQKGDKDLK